MMSLPYSDIRYTLRSLVDQILGYCEVLKEQPTAASEQLLAGVVDIQGLAQSVGVSLDAPKLNSRQLENLGQRVLTLSSHIGHRCEDLRRLASGHGQSAAARDLERLHKIAADLLPFAKELLLNHEALGEHHTLTAWPNTTRGATLPAPADIRPSDARLLVVDDNEGNRDLLARRLNRAGYGSVTVARNGREALHLVRQQGFDLVLLDVMMPELDGLGVLTEMKQDLNLRDIPVVMISAVDDVASVAHCIELGAEDYLPKPFDQVILQARIRGSIERKRLRDADKRRADELEAALQEISRARQVSERLLRNILPAAVAEELQEKNAVEPMYFEDVTIVFTDFVGFTLAAEKLSAEELVSVLHDYFTGMDRITERWGLEKLKTIGDSYMFVGGLPLRDPAHPVDALMSAFEILEFIQEMRSSGHADWSIRIGIHTGPVIAGVVGVRKFAFDIWGESVNIASRMESDGLPDRINISERTYSRVKDFFACQYRGKVGTKDGRELDMYLVDAVQPKLLAEAGVIPPAFARRYRTYFRKDLGDFPRTLRALT